MIKHRLTTYIIVLNEMANKCNKFAICKACKEAISQEYAYSKKIVNTKKCVKAHLSKCEYFFAKYGKEEGENILNKSDNETAKNNKNFKKRSNDYQESETDSDSNSTIFNTKTKPLDQYITHPLNSAQQKKWWYLLLKATISNGWSFRWVENKDSKEIFTFLNSTLKLPTRKYLTQIKGVINQTQRNQELEMIKQMYYSTSAINTSELEEYNESDEQNDNSDSESLESEEDRDTNNWDNIMLMLNQ
ncbi:4851_t:CDS:2, partial [Scutellospora calospora]